MKKRLLAILLICYGLSLPAQVQDRLLVGTSCECSSFITLFDSTSVTEETGFGKIFATPILPQDVDIFSYVSGRSQLYRKQSESTNSVFAVDVVQNAEVKCVYLVCGAVSATTREIAQILAKEVKFSLTNATNPRARATYFFKLSSP